MDRRYGPFIWDIEKEAARVFIDPKRRIFTDSMHSSEEPRYFCIGVAKDRVMTVRFTYREELIRIIGAGYWRKGRSYYEKN